MWLADYKYRSLHLALESSVARLSAELQHCAAKLAVFPKGSTVELPLLELLWGMEPPAARHTLRQLQAAGLVDTQSGVVTVPDLHLDYLRATSREQLPQWHAELLHRCVAAISTRTAALASSNLKRRLVCHWVGAGAASTVTALDLSGSAFTLRIGGDAIAPFAEALRQSSTLTKLNLSGNALGTRQVRPAVAVAPTHTRMLMCAGGAWDATATHGHPRATLVQPACQDVCQQPTSQGVILRCPRDFHSPL